MQRIQIIDSHTGGEPTRMVVGGFPDLGRGSMAERREQLRTGHDQWRRTCVLEPRGNNVIVGALLCEPVARQAAAGVIFFDAAGYLGMCGHGTIGVVASLAWLGRIEPGRHRIETPVGMVSVTLHDDGSVSVRNVPAWRHRKDVVVPVPGYGRVRGDVAWGGNWFFVIAEHAQRVSFDNLEALTDFTMAVRAALAAGGIGGADGHAIDHVQLHAEEPGGQHRNFVLCPGGAYDRSPCGTGTSAKVACLAADGLLAPGEVWEQTSIVGSRFQVSYEVENGKIVPIIRGRAHVCAETTLILDPDDPFCWGIVAG